MVALSVLDLSPIASGSTAGETLWRSVDLAEHAEALGFARYWVAEHHNAGAVASSAPEILIGQIAARTRAMRVGAGGIMLPNHSPLKVAELFRVLSAMFPGRIDLGLGRAAGTDPRTAAELRRGKPLVDPDEMAGELERLEGFLLADPPARGPFSRSIAAIPMGVPTPELWLLGSSDYSSALAARRGLPFAFAAHMSPGDAEVELRKYRATFRPSARLTAPTSLVSLAVICAPTSEEARRLAASAELGWLHFAQGLRDLPMPSEAEAKAHVDDPDQAAIRELFRERLIVGAPAEVAERVMAIRGACQADEVMLMTHVHDHEARRRSYALVAEALGLDKKVAPPARAVR